MAVENMSLTLF